MAERTYTERVWDEFQGKRRAAEARSADRKARLYGEIPGLRELDAQLAGTAPKIMNAILSGGNTSAAVAALREENLRLQKRRAELLADAGYPADYTDVAYECTACGDTGFVGIQMCACMRRALSGAMLEDSGLARLAETQRFDNFSTEFYKPGPEREAAQRSYRELSAFAEGFDGKRGGGFLLMGPTGLGKTHLSTATAAAVIEKGYRVVYKTMQDMVNDFEEKQFHGGDYDTVRPYFEADLLLIDDLGTELSNQFTVACLYNVLNSRINNARSTIISTNLTQKELRERYDDRITSRLFGTLIVLTFAGTDVRRQKLAGGAK